MAAEIPLTRGLAALVDDADAEWLGQWKWAACKNRNGFYAMRTQRVRGGAGKKLYIYMHRVICRPAEGMQVDHINGDKLDNRRANLRSCANAQNQANKGPNKNNKSGFKGVYLYRGVYRAGITIDGVTKWLGSYASIDDARQAYEGAARRFHGAFARWA